MMNETLFTSDTSMPLCIECGSEGIAFTTTGDPVSDLNRALGIVFARFPGASFDTDEMQSLR